MEASSQRYDRFFSGTFTSESLAFAESFILGSYRAEWPYDDQETSGPVLLVRKLLRRLGLRNQMRRQVHLVSGHDFDRKVKSLLDRLYSRVVAAQDTHVVLNNCFEPFNPLPGLDMLEGSRQIVVTRDPRDIYVSGLGQAQAKGSDRGLLAPDNDGVNKSFLATDDLAFFAKRFEFLHRHLYSGADPRVLRIRFEDLVLDYQRTVDRVLAFLGLPPSAHARKGSRFRPELSRKNIGTWRTYSRAEDIRFLEGALAGFLVPVPEPADGPVPAKEEAE
jgi:hypothetical protein